MNFLKRIEKLLGINDNKKKKKKETTKSTPVKKSVAKTSSKTTPLKRTTTTKSTPLKKSTTKSTPLNNQRENKYVRTTNSSQMVRNFKNNKGNRTIEDVGKELKSGAKAGAYIGKKTGNETYGGLAGIEQAGSSEIVNALQKGQKSKKKGTADTLQTFAEASFMPIHMLNSTIEAGKNFAKSKKSTKDKLINLGLDLSESMINTKGIELAGKLAPKKVTKEAIKTINKADEAVSKPYEKNAEKLNKEAQKYNKGTQVAGDVFGVVGRMAPSIGATALTKNPNVGLVTMGVSAKGSSTKEALNKGADLDTATKIGTAKGLIEVGTERLTGGLHYLGKGSLDDIAEKGIQKTLSKVGGQGVKRALLDKGLHGLYDVLGENLEETITDIVDTQIDKATVDPKAKYTLGDWGQTVGLTTASTILLNLLTRGMVGGVRVDMDKAINQTENQLNTKFTDKEKNLLKDNTLKDLMYKNAYDKANNRIQENKKLINKKVQEAMTLNQNKTLNTTEAQRQKINNAIDIRVGEISQLKAQNQFLQNQLDNNSNLRNVINEDRYISNENIEPINNDSFSIQDKINNSMTMSEAKEMLERAFNLSNMKEYTDYKINNVDEWINSDEWSYQIPIVIENYQELYNKYIGSNPDMVNYLYTIEDVIEAYKKGTLKTDKNKSVVNLDTSKDTHYEDNRFYAPKEVKINEDLYNVANQRITNKNRNETYKARANFIIGLHNVDASNLLNIDNVEINKKIKSWANYSQKAKNLSISLNKDVSLQNRWSGLENSSIVNNLSITNEELGKMVKSIKGDSNGFQRNYITSTMLALDTHIDYSNLSFEFDQQKVLNEKNCLGDYNSKNDLIRIGNGYQNTVAHEIGHYIDHLWGREIFGNDSGITDRTNITNHLNDLTENQKNFLNNFYDFFDDVEKASDISNEYSMSSTEEFARFVARFVEWTKNEATSNRYGYESKHYNDTYSESLFKRFVKVLQEKSYLDTVEKSNKKYERPSYQKDNIVNAFTHIAKFDKTEYNNADNVQLVSGEYNKLRAIVNDKTNNIKRGINKIELYDKYTNQYKEYFVYYKGTDNFKVIDVERGQNYYEDRTSNEFGKRNDRTRNTKGLGLLSDEEIKNTKTTTTDDGLSYDNKGQINTTKQSNIESNRNQESQELDSSFSNEEVNKLAKELDELDPEVMAQAFLEKEGDKLKDVAKESGYNLTDKQIKQLYRQNVSKTDIGTLKRIVLEAMENRNYEIDRIAKITKNKNIKILGDHINNMQGEIETNLNTAQIDGEGNVIGESLSDIFAPYTKAKEDVAFNDYLFHRSNIERHKNGVGSQVPMEDSQQLVKAYEEKYPNFKKGAEKVNNYNRNLLKRQVESGLISQETADNITSKYEFYVPFYENQYLDDNYVPSDKVELKSGNTLRRAQGGADANLLLFQDAMAKQTQQAISNINKNELYKEIVNTLPKKAIDVMENVNPDEFNALVKEGKKHYLTAFENGTPVQVEISQELFNELNKTFENQLKSGEHAMRVVWKPIQKLNDIKRNLVTTWSPSFVVTNALKDIQDAYLNTKYTKDFAKAYPTAIKEMVTGKDTSGNLQKFLNMYGKPNIMGDYSLEGVDADVSNLMKNGKVNNSALVKIAKKIPQINEVIEMIPRYTEYLASLENGCSQKEALYNAREVTVNFGRGGYFAKALNRNGMTFFNAQIQGFSKFFRNFHDAPVRTTAKATAYGLTVALINQLMHGDDDDYDLLPDYIKDNYYLFKVSSNEELKAMPKDLKEKYLIKKGKATFIRIPRGRMLSIFSSMINRGKDRAQGKRGELNLEEDIKSWFTNATNQVGLPDIGSSNLFAPFIDSAKNKTWYGGQLVPDRLLKKDGKKLPATQQYDASTDKISIWLGQKTGISPYKINYILDQYTGGIGDMLIPLITEEAQSSSNGALGMALAPLKDKFTADTINDNKNVTNFYSKAEKLGEKSNELNATGRDKLKSGYMDNVSYQMGALYKQIRDVQADKNLSKKEKYERYEVLKSQINELAKNGLENVNKVKGDEYYGEVEENGKTKQLFRSAKGNYYELYDNQKEALDKANLSVKERNNLYKTKDEISKYLKSSTDKNKYSKRYAIIKDSNNSQSAKAVLYNQNKQFYQKDPTPLVKDNLVDSFLDIESQNIKSDYDKNGKIVYNSKRNKIAKAINKLNLSAKDKQKLYDFYYPSKTKGSSSGVGSKGSKKRSSGSKKAPTKGSKRTTTTKTPKITRTKVTPVKLSNKSVKLTPVKSKSTSSNKYYQEALKNLLFKKTK